MNTTLRERWTTLKPSLKNKFFDDEGFYTKKGRLEILAPMPQSEEFDLARQKLRKEAMLVVPEVRSLYSEPLLTREQERHLFRQYNYHKYRAQRIIIHHSTRSDCNISDSEFHLEAARNLKKRLAASNARLVMNIAKRQQEYRFNPHPDLLYEIISDGNMGLIHAVDCFDYRMGNKFSTYATWAIITHVSRGRYLRTRNMAFTGADEILESIPDRPPTEEFYDDTRVVDIIKDLKPGQRKVIEQYFIEGKKLQEIASFRGISKERVRQIKEAGLQAIREKLVLQ